MQRPLHTDQAYAQELEALTAVFGQMCHRAETMVADAVRSVFARDPALAREVVTGDDVLDRLELDLDARAEALLARRAPMGRDLRLLIGVLKAATDLERVGDLAVNIAKRSLELESTEGLDAPAELRTLADRALSLLQAATAAFLHRDAASARRLPERDAAIDELNRALFERLMSTAMARPDQVARAMALSSVSRNLERIGDHAVNVAERVVYVAEGEELRHKPPVSQPGAHGESGT